MTEIWLLLNTNDRIAMTDIVILLNLNDMTAKNKAIDLVFYFLR